MTGTSAVVSENTGENNLGGEGGGEESEHMIQYVGYLVGRQIGETPSSSAKRTIEEALLEREGEDAMRPEGGLEEH